MMSVDTVEKFTTGNAALDMELPHLTFGDMVKLADYARYLRWSHKEDDDGDDWADAPLTAEEEEAIRQGREDFKNGNYLTLEEFMRGLDDVESSPE